MLTVTYLALLVTTNTVRSTCYSEMECGDQIPLTLLVASLWNERGTPVKSLATAQHYSQLTF